MTKFGQVIAYDEMKHMATVEYARPDACEKCGGCGSATQKGSITLQAQCKIGDWVRLELPDGRFLQAAAMAYILPLCGFLGGLVLGQWLMGGDGGAVLGAAIGLGLTLGILRLNERRIQGREEWSARIVSVYDHKPSAECIGCSGEGL